MPARILIIEDNQTNLDLMIYLLNAFGYAPTAAPDGETGCEVALGQTPDLIICDVHLPGIDGYEVVRRLKSNNDLSEVPVIAVTALAMVGDRDKVLAAGFDGYIPKPIMPETFVEQVESFLRPGQHSHLTPSEAVAEPNHSAMPTNRATVLVVDNSPVNIEFARHLLEHFGYTVIAAPDVKSALALARQSVPDLILSDINMDGGSGFDLIKDVKANSQLSDVPFIFITSTYTDPECRAEGLALGADKFLMRPLEPQLLLDEIESCLRKREEE